MECHNTHSKQHRHKCEHRKSNNNKNETTFNHKLVSQEMHVERQNFKCIINFNTTVCDHSINETCKPKALYVKSNFKRIVPQCMRHLCHQSRYKNHSKMKDSLNEKKTKCHKDHSKNKQTVCYKTASTDHEAIKKRKHTHKCRHKKKHNKQTKQNSPKMLSNNLEMDLEDISTTSLDSYLEIPTSYKHVLNPRVQESKLDLLIRKAKERERKLMDQSGSQSGFIPWYDAPESNYPVPVTCSEINATLYSRSTFMLDQKEQGNYSPSINGICPSPTFERYFHFSNVFQSHDFELVIKESTMSIDAYSPTHLEIKQELKIEPSYF